MAASGSSSRPAASDPAISRDGLGTEISHISGRSSGSDTTRHRNPDYHSAYDAIIARHTAAFANQTEAPRWKADQTRILPAPSTYSDPRQGHVNIAKSPSPSDVYRHNPSSAFQRPAVSFGHGARSFGNEHMRAPPDPPDPLLNRLADSPPLNHSMHQRRGYAESAHADGGDERAYWSGFEDGVQYERQREAFAQRSNAHARRRITDNKNTLDSGYRSLSSISSMRRERQSAYSPPPPSPPTAATTSQLAGFIPSAPYVADLPPPHIAGSAISASHRPLAVSQRSYNPESPWERRHSSSANSFVTASTVRQEPRGIHRDRWASSTPSTSAGSAFSEITLGSEGLRPVSVSDRSTISCDPCRQRKTKCDGNPPRPCGLCVKRGAEDECSYVTSVRRRGPGKPKSTVQEQSNEHSHREGTLPGHGVLRRTYTVDSVMPEDRHGVTRRREVDRLSPGREKRPRTNSPESERASRPASVYPYDGEQDG